MTIKLRKQDLVTGELNVQDSKNAFLPKLNGSASQSFNFGRGLTAQNTYANRNTSNFQVGASFSVPIFSGLRNIRTYEQSKLNLKQLAWQLESVRDNVSLNIIAQYLQVLYSREVMETSKSQVDLSSYELTRRSSLAQEGKIAEVEVLEAESQLAQDKLSYVNSVNDYNLAILELTQLLQLETADDFQVVPLSESDPIIPSADQVYSVASQTFSSVKAAESSVEVSKSTIKVAETGYIPTLSLGGGIGSSYYKLNGVENQSFKTQFKQNYNTYIGISLNVPIFDGLSTRTQVRRAKAQLFTAQLQVDQVKSELYKSIEQAHVQACGAKDKYITAETSTNAANVAFEAISEKYNLGRATSAEYEQSKTNLFKARIQQIQAHYEYLLRYRILTFYQDKK
ncbi:MAG: TolC family protein [Muribaculaceae bacterium]|nr:TolC family protein [Muribaculaceae bacterium]